MSNKHIYIKITTVPADLSRESKEFELFFDKYKEAKNLLNYEDAYETYKKDAYKHYLFGKIHSITIASEYGEGKLGVKVLKGEEKNILQAFYNLYTEEFFKEAKSVIWRAEFVLPFLSMRAAKNNVKPTARDLNHAGKRIWGLDCLCLYEYLNGVSYFVPSIEEVAFMHGLECELIENSSVQQLIETGQENIVDESGIQEVQTMVNIHRKLQYLEPILEVTTNIVEVSEVQEIKEIPPLERLYNENQLTESIKEDLKRSFGKKRITKKDKENLFTIIRGVYVQTDFINGRQDSKKVIAEKEKQIKEFLETI